jgi:hypothetical protein
VKLRSKQISHELVRAFSEIEQDSVMDGMEGSLPFSEITDAEIESLFSN